MAQGAKGFGLLLELRTRGRVFCGNVIAMEVMRKDGGQILVPNAIMAVRQVFQFEHTPKVALKPFAERFGTRDLPVERVARQNMNVGRFSKELIAKLFERSSRETPRIQPA